MTTIPSKASAGQVIDTNKGSAKEQGEETSAASKDSVPCSASDGAKGRSAGAYHRHGDSQGS